MLAMKKRGYGRKQCLRDGKINICLVLVLSNLPFVKKNREIYFPTKLFCCFEFYGH